MSRMKQFTMSVVKRREVIHTFDITCKHCCDCPNHTMIADPDPSDWMRSSDQAMTCFATPNPTRDPSSRQHSKRSLERVVASRIEASDNLTDYPIPVWCPLRPTIPKEPPAPVTPADAALHIDRIRILLGDK